MKKLFLMAAVLLAAVACDKGGEGNGNGTKAAFEAAVVDLTANSCAVNVTPADKEMPYLVMLMTQTEVEGVKDSDIYTAIMDFIRAQGIDINKQLKVGDQKISEPRAFYSNTTSYVVIFGYKNGRRTTDLTKIKFTSPAHSFDSTGAATLDVKFNKVVDAGNGNADVKLTLAPGNGAKNACFTSYVKGEETSDEAKLYGDIYDKSVVKGSAGKVGFYLDDVTRDASITTVLGTNMLFVGFGIDANGKFGPITRLEVQADITPLR